MKRISQVLDSTAAALAEVLNHSSMQMASPDTYALVWTIIILDNMRDRLNRISS